MPANVSISIYLGAGETGQALYQKIDAHCKTSGISISEFVKGLIVKSL